MNGMIFYHLNMHDIRAVVEYSKKTQHKLYLPTDHPYFTEEVRHYGYANWWEASRMRVRNFFEGSRQTKGYAVEVMKRRLYQLLFRIRPDETQQMIRCLVKMKKTDFLKIKEDLSLDFVIIPGDNYAWLQDLIKWCNEESVTVIVLRKEGIPFPLLVPEEIESPFSGDYLCVVGPIQEKIWLEQGVPRERLFVCGYPRMDFYQERDKWPSREEVLKRYGLDPGKRTVLFPAQNAIPDDIGCNFTRLKKETLIELFKLARRNPDIQVIIKPHKKQGMALSRMEWFARLGLLKNYRLVFDDIDIRELIVNTDLIVAGNSTTIMEGMIVGRPTVLTKWDEAMKPGLLEYYEWKASPTALSKQELATLVLDLLDKGEPPKEFKPGRERMIYEYLYKQDGKVCARIFEVIDRVESKIKQSGELASV